jgi:hypothetical protein
VSDLDVIKSRAHQIAGDGSSIEQKLRSVVGMLDNIATATTSLLEGTQTGADQEIAAELSQARADIQQAASEMNRCADMVQPISGW